MRIDDILQSAETPLAGYTKRRAEEEEKGFSLASWGSDSVSISEEAIAKQQAAKTASANNDKEKNTGEDSLSKASSGGGSGGVSTTDTAEQIEAIDKQIKALQAQLAQVMGSNMPDETKESRAAGINQQIAALTAQKNEIIAAQAKAA